MNLRLTNSALLGLLFFLTLSGAYGIVWPMPGWLYDAHRYAGLGLIALVPWKIGIAWRSLARGLRPRLSRNVLVGLSLLLAAATLTVLALALVWAGNLWPHLILLGDTPISWHWMMALGLLPFLLLHVWRRWPRPRVRELASRRAALRYLGWGAAALVGWRAMEWLAAARQTPGSPRAATGSREQGSFAGNAFPVTQGFAESGAPVDVASWSLSVGGAVAHPQSWSYGAILARPVGEVTATLDCTTGWYTTQRWQGVPLAELLDEAGLMPGVNSVRLTAASGYVVDFPLEEARKVLLATHVGGETLDHWHGYPVRAVAPTRRGWHWLKWLVAVEVRAGPRA